jgi:tyrosinase
VIRRARSYFGTNAGSNLFFADFLFRFVTPGEVPNMNVQIDIDGTDQQGRAFLTWHPVKATARIVNDTGSGVDIVLRSAGTGGGLVFDTVRSDQGTSTLTLSLPAGGAAVPFWIAGEFQRPSSAYGDAIVQATDKTSGAVLGQKAVMVRIRKNAIALSAAERDRYLAALGTLNARGQGAYRDFRDMHTDKTTAEMHGNVGFLPWHRAYVLDLERALQAIDATVAAPYWRFDQPAPSLFARDFMGESDPNNRVLFNPGHALEHWRTDNNSGITRGLRFPLNGPANVISEARTIALGGQAGIYAQFRNMEINPHGNAHVSFDGPINFVPTAVKDPLFFLLHANVDRLWAKWQWLKHRESSADANAYQPPPNGRIGHRLGDTMWPWNGDRHPPRPSTAPGGPFPPTDSTPAPGKTPKVEQMLDYLAVNGGDPLGYGYDDVPFELPPDLVAGAAGAGRA